MESSLKGFIFEMGYVFGIIFYILFMLTVWTMGIMASKSFWWLIKQALLVVSFLCFLVGSLGVIFQHQISYQMKMLGSLKMEAK